MTPSSILRHAWLLLVIVTFANASVWWFRGRAEIAENPALEWGYRRLILGYLIYGNIPWLIVGAAFELPPAFFRPLLIAFAITIVVYWIAGFYWVVFGGGAEDLAAHPGLLRRSPRDPRTIKVHFSSLLGLGLVAYILVIGYFVFVAIPASLR